MLFKLSILETQSGSKNKMPPISLSCMGSRQTKQFAFSKQPKQLAPTNQLDLNYLTWLSRSFPNVVNHPFAERHLRLWEWFDALTPGVRPDPRIEVWPRGGAKSTTAELGCTFVGLHLKRRFALYVCATQEQADYHASAIATLLERIGSERAVGKFGNSALLS